MKRDPNRTPLRWPPRVPKRRRIEEYERLKRALPTDLEPAEYERRCREIAERVGI